ncbi:MAG: hypothetical protein NTV25_05885 [Methanothrix sp.]|nr:hypothetical protein [Methanothrix sp.]
MVLAIAILLAPVMAQGAYGGDGVDILGDGIFETDGSAFSFPVDYTDTNYDSVQVGDDKATAFGTDSGFPFGFRNGPANAENNLEIKKNQDSGICSPCDTYDDEGYPTGCMDSCLNLNIEQIKVGNREALAFGFASAVNNVKIVTNQAESEAAA